MEKKKSILVTGATGYIGGRLTPLLLEKGHEVQVLVRDKERLQGRPWADQVKVIEGDVFKPETLPPAMDGVEAAYYLIHSMSESDDFEKRDLVAARNFGTAAKRAGVERIIYLGGLGDSDADLSKHLQSRQETGRVLRESGLPVTEFRAAIIVGSGSISFEMIRYLTERIPIMIAPRWVFTKVQPISIKDILNYLSTALHVSQSMGKIIEVGGADQISYGDMMLGYAQVRGLKRHIVPVPVLTPRLSSYWVHWTTPVPASITQPLIEGLRNEVIVRDDLAKRLFPNIHPDDYQTAVKEALENLEADRVETRWSDALASSQGDHSPVMLKTHQGMIVEQRQKRVSASPARIYETFTSLGGERGWLYFNWAWHLRGIIDRLIGGAGLRRGRRHSHDVHVGDAIDFWRVEEVKPGRLLRLRAEMKLPGRAWLQFETQPQEEQEETLLIQTAFFAPKGLFGFLYWYLLYPLHSLIFSGMIQKLKEEAEACSS